MKILNFHFRYFWLHFALSVEVYRVVSGITKVYRTWSISVFYVESLNLTDYLAYPSATLYGLPLCSLRD